MRRLLIGGLLCASLVPALAGLAWGQSSFAWWKSEQFQRDLGLSAEQSARIDSIFQTTLPRLRQSKEELDRLEAELSRLIEADADEGQASRQLDKIEIARGQLHKMRTLMLMHMRQLLSSDQRVRFKALHERGERGHRVGQQKN